MISIYSPDHELHNPPHQLLDGALIPVFEAPGRASIIHAALERAALGPILPPRTFDVSLVHAIHDEGYLDFLEHGYERWVAAGGSPAAVLPDTLAVRWMARPCANPLAAPGYYAFDLSAPIVAGTYRAALASAAVALTGAALLREGQRAAYALCRPPGHHAGSDMCGGYCFLNNAAIAAQYLLRTESVVSGQLSVAAGHRQLTTDNGQRTKVAILDIDFHHGNGTQQIFYARDDVLFVSIHADPARHYPFFSGHADERGAGAGLGYNLNLPLEAGVTDARFLEVLEQALAAVADFGPRFLVLSAGVDTFADDPVAQGDFALTSNAYPAIGRRIAGLGFPTLIVQEGGYAIAALGENVVGLLRGFDSGKEGV